MIQLFFRIFRPTGSGNSNFFAGPARYLLLDSVTRRLGRCPPSLRFCRIEATPGIGKSFLVRRGSVRLGVSGLGRCANTSPAHHEPAPMPRSTLNRRVCLQIAYKQHQKKKPATDSIAGFPVLVWGG